MVIFILIADDHRCRTRGIAHVPGTEVPRWLDSFLFSPSTHQA
jgi:hypothetical protein